MALQPEPAKLIWQLAFEGSWPTSVAFLGSGRRLAAGNQLGQLFVWDLPEPGTVAPDESDKPSNNDEPRAPSVPPVRQLVGHDNGISRLVATRDGAWLVSAGLDRTLRLWQSDAPASGTAEVVLDAETRQRRARRVSDKDRPAILEAPGIEVPTQAAAAVLQGHEDWILALGISRDERRLISGDCRSQVIVWDLARREPLRRLHGYPWNWIVAAALSPDGQTALVSEYRYKRDDFDIPAPALKLYDLGDGAEKLDLLKVQFEKYDPQATSDGAAQVWRKFVADGLIAAEFSPDGKLLAVAQGGETDHGKIHLLDVETGKLLRDVASHRYGATDVKFSSDGKYLLSTGRDTMVQITAVEDGKEIAKLGKSRGGQFFDWYHALALSPDERFLAAADIAGTIHVWQLGESAQG